MIREYIKSMREQLRDRNLKEVSQSLRISYVSMRKFANFNQNLSTKNLIKIDEYLNGGRNEVQP